MKTKTIKTKNLSSILFLAVVVAIGLSLTSCTNEKGKGLNTKTLAELETPVVDQLKINKEIILNIYKAEVNGDWDALGKWIADDVMNHTAGPVGAKGLETSKAMMQSFFAAFPDLKVNVQNILADGDMVSTHFTITGTHKNNFMGTPATGNKINFGGMELFRIKNGKVVDFWAYMDNMTMMQQLGMMQGPGE